MEQEKSMHHKWWKLSFIIIFILSFLLLVYIAFFKKDALRLETLKTGGSTNMKLVEQLYRSPAYQEQQKQAIQQVLDSMKSGTAQQPTQAATGTAQDATAPTSTVDPSALATIKKDAYVEGNKNARITVLEYSDLVCPYCKRQSDSKILDQLVSQYGNDVNVIYRNYLVHPQAEKLEEGSLCIWELLGAKKYYEYIAQVFDLTDTSDTAVIALAKSLWAPEAAFTTCFNSGKYATSITNSTDEGRTLFGVTGTPGNVIIDNQKNTFTLVAGAYPIETFQADINKILGK